MDTALLNVLVIACLLCGGVRTTDWWKTATVYQIYPRSFMDSDGDGIGDLKGIEQRADYLEELGISAIWLSPIFKSPQKDFGYDISDFKQVDPIYGKNEDLYDLINKLKSKNIKVLLDYVPNHTSDQHEWFENSVNGEATYKDWYVWRDKKGVDPKTNEPLPPNNWQSVFGGSAWQWNDKRQQFYLHQFAVAQPDLNYSNPAVVEAMTDNIVFWMEKGVDGFRVDAVPFLFEDPQLGDEPLKDQSAEISFGNLDHIYTQNQPETYKLLKKWSSVIDSHSKKEGKSRVMLIEAYADPKQTAEYFVGPNAVPFNFNLLGTLDARYNTAFSINDAINTWLQGLPQGGTSNWVAGNHDQRRISTRMGSESVDAINMLLGFMPGIMVSYNGEEIGMEDTLISWNEAVDVSGINRGRYRYLDWDASRDPERTPMQWSTCRNAGFTTASKPWLPVNPNYWRLNVKVQQEASKSHLKVYKLVLETRKSFTLKQGSLNVQVPDNSTVIIERSLEGHETYIAIINVGSEELKQDLSILKTKESRFIIHIASVNSGYESGDVVTKADSLELRPKAAVVLTSYRPGYYYTVVSGCSQ